jgi:hypothetical protein
MSTKDQEMVVPGANDLAEVKQRRRLENLLYTRRRVAELAAEHRSHQMDDAIELYQLQLETELVIADEFPDEFEARIGSWAEVEAEAEHHPLVTKDDCSLCEAVAAADRVRFPLPRAA